MASWSIQGAMLLTRPTTPATSGQAIEVPSQYM